MRLFRGMGHSVSFVVNSWGFVLVSLFVNCMGMNWHWMGFYLLVSLLAPLVWLHLGEFVLPSINLFIIKPLIIVLDILWVIF